MLAIVFMVVVGAISAATLSMLTSSLQDRVSLDAVRNRQYAADAGIEAAIADARSHVATWARDTYAAPELAAVQTFLRSGQCGTPPQPATPKLNGVDIWVKCSPAPAIRHDPTDPTKGYFQFNVIFTACTDAGCSNPPVINAQVNFDYDSSSQSVQRTFVQSWSVNT